ncbi:MAG: hypothetical protein KJS64_02420 [Acidobacteria bacterium]|nr:hypothetical protein [Acidobacteriota bacterium]
MRFHRIVPVSALLIALLPVASGATGKIAPAKTDAEVATKVTAALALKALPSTVTPTLSNVANDSFLSYDPECASYHGSCTFGNSKSTKVLRLFGDSHAQQWLPAIVDAFGATYKIQVSALYECTPASISNYSPLTHSVDPQCAAWRTQTISSIVSSKPAMVLVAESTYSLFAEDQSPLTDSELSNGLKTTLLALKASKAKIAVIGDNPAFAVHPTSCISANQTNLTNCVKSPATQTPPNVILTAGEKSGALAAGVGYVPTASWFCSGTGSAQRCPMVINGMLPYFDWSHITVTYAHYLATVLKTAVTKYAK